MMTIAGIRTLILQKWLPFFIGCATTTVMMLIVMACPVHDVCTKVVVGHVGDFENAMGNFDRFESLEGILSTNRKDLLSFYLKENKGHQRIGLNTWMGAYNCYDEYDLQPMLMAQLACYMLDPRLAVAMWYREDRRISRVLCLVYVAYMYPVDLMSGDFDVPKGGEDTKSRIRRSLSHYRRECTRYEANERRAREEEVEYVERNSLRLISILKAIMNGVEGPGFLPHKVPS